tara:strand:+ start:137 stop:604 length:468 start_codon:yes stop_codon:yes gene_type:complete
MLSGVYPYSRTLWTGGDVSVCLHPPANKLRDNFFPDPDLIVTEYAHELSGMFIALRDIFYEHRLVDARNKYEFFGRLARAAQVAKGTKTSRRYSKSYMLLSVLWEAKKLHLEIESKTLNIIYFAPAGIHAFHLQINKYLPPDSLFKKVKSWLSTF